MQTNNNVGPQNDQQQDNSNIGKQVDGPDTDVVNGQDQKNPVNEQEGQDKEKGFEQGNKNDNTNEGNIDKDRHTDDDELPGRHDDSETTIKEIPKMSS